LVHIQDLGFVLNLGILERGKELSISGHLAALIARKLCAFISNYLTFFLIILSDFGFLKLNRFNYLLHQFFKVKLVRFAGLIQKVPFDFELNPIIDFLIFKSFDVANPIQFINYLFMIFNFQVIQVDFHVFDFVIKIWFQVVKILLIINYILFIVL
jgi:hypothetical protein